MAGLPTKIYLDDNEFIIFQHNFSGGHRPKAVNSEITISGKRSRQFAWSPREWKFTLWLKPEDKSKLENIWADDGAASHCQHTLRIDSSTAYAYTVTFDEYEPKPHEAVEERWLADISLVEFDNTIGMYRPGTLIASAVLTANATSVTFSNIPSTYINLMVTALARTDNADENDNVKAQFNSDSGNNYGWVNFAARGVFDGTFTGRCVTIRSDTYLLVGRAEGANASAGNFGTTWFMLPSYANTTTRKVVSSGAILKFGDGSEDSDYSVGLFGGLWRSTAAITSITLYPQTGSNFVAGSRFYLWGLK